ncbi:MAG: helix-hairpin-helix domain-containing protein [Burkholderiaceae bacterium]|nr:helix-hairpin-helix domain-containing protein [Burkholderiaceae bacterium]
MLKKILAVMVMMYAAVSFAAVDVNKATAAELDGIKGIGPVISAKILDEKKKGGNFKDWDDLVKRVNGVGEANAAKFSSEGLTVGGASFKGAAAAPAKKDEKPAAAKDAKDAKPAAKAEEKKADTKPAAAVTEKKSDAKADVKADPKAETKAQKEADAKAKADAKAAKSAKPAATDAKADAKPAAKDAAKTDAPKAAEPAAKK